MQLEKHYTKSPQYKPRPFVQLLDCFHHTGPNGTHNCLVTELLGPPLSNMLECYEYRGQTFRPDTILRASCQMLDALDFCHQAGIAHGGMTECHYSKLSEWYFYDWILIFYSNNIQMYRIPMSPSPVKTTWKARRISSIRSGIQIRHPIQILKYPGRLSCPST